MSNGVDDRSGGAVVLFFLRAFGVPILFGLLLYWSLAARDGGPFAAVILAAFFAYLQARIVGMAGICRQLKDRLEEQRREIDRLIQAERRNHG